MGEALRLAADLWEEKERLALENKEMAPKADVYDRIIDRNNLYNATQVAQKFGQSAVWMNKQLEQFGVYNRSVKRGRVFQQWFVDKGYGIMRETETGHSQAMFFAEGEMWIIGKLTEEGLI
ncbi:DNA-binding protein [Salmonella phage vB_SenS_Psm105]